MHKPLIIALALSLGGCDEPNKPVEPGWYRRADSNAIGNNITSFNMRMGETGVRCLCGEGFEAVFSGDKFKVTKAAEGYKDTVGREFYVGADGCPSFNCDD